KAGPVMLEVKPKKSNSRRTHSIYSTDEENWIYIPVPKIVDKDCVYLLQLFGYQKFLRQQSMH
ncbi:MAG: hypothetical protein ACEY3M_15235, partial [Wolbachia sp.]